MTDTDTPRPSLADEMLAAHRRRMLDMPTEVIIPRAPDTSRNSQRPPRRTSPRRIIR